MGSATPIPTRSCGRRCSCAPTRSPRDAPARARSSSSSCSSASTGGVLPRRAEPRLGRCERRPRSARASRAPARRRGRGVVRRRAPARPGRARARRSRSRCALRGEGGALARQRDAVHGRRSARSGSCARGGWRKPPTSPARSRSRRSRAPGRRFIPAVHALRPVAWPGGRPRRTSSRCSRARRSTSRTAGATRCRTRTRCAARRRCTGRPATCSTTSTTRSPSS